MAEVISHSELVMNENPMNIPNVPPTFPTRVIQVIIRYSFLTILNGQSDLRLLVSTGNRNVQSIRKSSGPPNRMLLCKSTSALFFNRCDHKLNFNLNFVSFIREDQSCSHFKYRLTFQSLLEAKWESFHICLLKEDKVPLHLKQLQLCSVIYAGAIFYSPKLLFGKRTKFKNSLNLHSFLLNIFQSVTK